MFIFLYFDTFWHVAELGMRRISPPTPPTPAWSVRLTLYTNFACSEDKELRNVGSDSRRAVAATGSKSCGKKKRDSLQGHVTLIC